MRFSHNVGRVLRVSSEAVALLATLWLRGPQTAAELRSASERLHRFADLSSVEGFLNQLATRAEEAGGPLVELLPRATGSREPRWAQRLSPLPVTGPVAVDEAVNSDALIEELPGLRAGIAQLHAELAELRERVRRLQEGKSTV